MTGASRAKWLDWPGLAVLGGAGLYFASFVRYGYNLGEDGDVVYLIYRTFSGHRPYLDFASGYTPGFFYFNAALFHVFGANLLVLRGALAAVNALAVFGLYRLGAAVMPPLPAAVPALAYVALMPVFAGECAMFNVPYPAWYVVLTWVTSTLAVVRFCAGAQVRWMAVAGLLVGVACAFKPNTGAFNLAALAMVLLCTSAARGTCWQRLLWWSLLAGVLGALAAVFHFQPATRDARLLLWPLFAIGLLRLVAPQRQLGTLSPRQFAAGATALVGGFAAVTLPWMLYYLAELGRERFLREVLFIGSGHELFFLLPIRDLGAGDAVLALGAVAFVIAGRALRRLEVAPRLVAVAAATLLSLAMAGILTLAPMPEGFSNAVVQRAQHVSFGAALIVHWAGVLVLARRFFTSTGAANMPTNAAIVALAVSAPCLYLSIYPRSDFFHWLLSAPVTLVLGMWCYWQVARTWLAGERWSRVAALPACAAVLILAAPNVLLATRLQLTPADDLAQLNLAHAPVVLEAGRRQRFDDLQRAVEFIRQNSEPHDTLLGFPNLHLVNFLSARQSPARYGYFHPGWPDHVLEAQIVNAIESRRTPLMILNRDPLLFMGHASLYYLLLRRYVQRNYEPAARFGSYDILRRRGAKRATVASQPTPTDVLAQIPADCAAALAAAERERSGRSIELSGCWRMGVSPALQGRAVLAARAAQDADGAWALADAVRAGTLAPGAMLPAVRVIGQQADARTAPVLVAARERLTGQARDELDTALFNVASRAFILRTLFVPRTEGEEEVRADPRIGAAALAWLAEGQSDLRLRFAGAWIAGVRADSAAEPGLRRLLAEPDVAMQAVAADALLRLGVADGVIEPLLAGLAYDEMFLPGAVLAWSQANPERARVVLAEAFRRGNDKQRETLAFIAGALGDRVLGETILGGITDPLPRVRIAAIWAAGVLDLEAARADIERAWRGDSVEQVRDFAQASLAWLGVGGEKSEARSRSET